jgi:hypothetical protein
MIDPKRYFAPMPVRLPVSGYNVLVRRISNFTLLASGGFPSDLTSLVWRLSQSEGENALDSALREDNTALSRVAALVDKIVPHALVSPKVGPETRDLTLADYKVTGFDEEESVKILSGVIALVDLQDLDKNAIFLYAQGMMGGPVTDLAPFREDGQRPVAGPSGETVQANAVEPAGATEEQHAGA